MKKIIAILLGLSLAVTVFAQTGAKLNFPEVFRDDNVVFYQVNDQLWIGNGNVMSSETLYIVAGNDKAVLIDTGTTIPGLDKIVEGILKDKPYDVILTHSHPDHAGGLGNFNSVWLAKADESTLPQFAPDFKGTINYLKEGQKIQLGGRTLEVVFTPGHTAGSVTFMDKANHYGFSGDSFGNGNLLLGTDFSTIIATCKKTLKYMQKNNIYYLYNGHFSGRNAETTKQIFTLQTLCEDLLSGKAKGADVQNNMGGNHRATVQGLNVNYGDRQMK